MKRLLPLVLALLLPLLAPPAVAPHCSPLHVYSEMPTRGVTHREWSMDASRFRCEQPIRQLDKAFRNVDEDRFITGRWVLIVFDDPTLSLGPSLNATVEGLGHLGWRTTLVPEDYVVIRNFTSLLGPYPSPTGEDDTRQGYVSNPLPVSGAGTFRVSVRVPSGQLHQVTYVGVVPPSSPVG